LTPVIHAPTLDLVSMSPAFMRASLAGDIAGAERVLGASLPSDWPDCKNLLELRLKQLEEDPAYEPWSLRAMVLRGTAPRCERAMIGHIGCHTLPGAAYLQPYSPMAVEFGFEVFPAYRRQGFAREAALALMDWAAREHGQRTFVVSISPVNTPSLGLAAQLGFVHIGHHIDEVDGWEDIFELRR
jgi:RimJ/RimL family protein N-acetyltransferase